MTKIHIYHEYTLHCCLAVNQPGDQHPRNLGIWVEGTFPLGVSRVGMGSIAYSGAYRGILIGLRAIAKCLALPSVCRGFTI